MFIDEEKKIFKFKKKKEYQEIDSFRLDEIHFN